MIWLPRLLTGLIVCAYWARVLKMAARQRRKRRRANLVPPEPIGRWIRLIWAPVIVLWVTLPLGTALLQPHFLLLRPLWNNLIFAWLGAAVAFVCLIASVICWRAMGRAWRMGIDPAEETPLIREGPFALARHPIYALSQLMMLATMLVVPSLIMIGAGLLHIAFLHWEAAREDRHLAKIHGLHYEAYQRRVGAFLPRLRAKPQ